MQGECVYKIISIRKRHPIFICKAIQINQHTEPLMPQRHSRDSPFSHPRDSSFNHPAQGHTPFALPAYSPSHQAHSHHLPLHPKEKSHQLSSPRAPPKQRDYVPSHSTSCDLKRQVKVSQSSGQLDSKSKQLKSIKEYLKLAYKRNQRERRSSSYKLPQIRQKEHSPNNQEDREDNSKLQPLANMKEVVRRIKRKQKQVVQSVPASLVDDSAAFRVDTLSGWEEGPHFDQF